MYAPQAPIYFCQQLFHATLSVFVREVWIAAVIPIWTPFRWILILLNKKKFLKKSQECQANEATLPSCASSGTPGRTERCISSVVVMQQPGLVVNGAVTVFSGMRREFVIIQALIPGLILNVSHIRYIFVTFAD